MSHSLQFRIWDRQERKFVRNTSSLEKHTKWIIDSFSGEVQKLVALQDGDFGSGKYEIEDNPNFYAQGVTIIHGYRYVTSQYTGLKDKKGEKVFEGDVVRFKYFVGDMAWADMDEKERDAQKSNINKTFKGVVRKAFDSNNFQLEVPKKDSIDYFPIAYAGGYRSEIIGNMYENAL